MTDAPLAAKRASACSARRRQDSSTAGTLFINPSRTAMQIFLAVIAHPFLVALALFMFAAVATMVADYFRNGAGLEELSDLFRQRKAGAVLTVLVVYSLCYLLVNALCLAAHFILDHA
jgi:hypothetical protein